jgi:hypothetical protein
MNIKAVITTGDIEEQDTFINGYHCILKVNGKFKGDLYADTREELQSLCDHIKTQTNGK